jgi:hypothetical protein
MRRLSLLFGLILLLMLALPAQAAPPSAPADICFQQVPDCITGRFAQYWRDNGGLQVFGLPLSPASKQRTGEGPVTYLVQYFERARFELHPKEAKPYDVLLSRLGVDQLAAQGRDWQTFAKADPSAPHYFAETGHAIAPQFWGFWSSHGLEFDGNKTAKSFNESLALFGMPVSEAQMEQSSDGKMYLTQWFERARFEFHSENQPPYDVLLGLLGADLVRQQAPPPPPPGLPGIPPITGNCVQNAPAPAEGAQAWVTVPEPTAESQFNSVCARLIVNGQPVKDAEVKVVLHYRKGDDHYGPVKTGDNGVAEQGFNIGDRKLANRNIEVPIDVQIDAPGGQEYTAKTSFTPRFPK